MAQETGQKMVNLAQPVRVALTAKTASLVYEIISILGGEEALPSRTPSSLPPRGSVKRGGELYPALCPIG